MGSGNLDDHKIKTGLIGLKENWTYDLRSGFLVFLLALPLSLGIAKASGFPAAMGVLTAMVGGLVTPLFRVSELTIKGPAAGLITICSGAIMEFGGGEKGWMIATAAIMTAAVLQIFLALLRMGSLSDFFPHSAVHGMLAAIGIIIIAKQIPVLLGDDPTLYKGEGPIDLLLDIPRFVEHAHWHIAIVGILGLIIMFTLPAIRINFLKKIPAPMIVLFLAIPLSLFWHFKETEPDYSLVHIGDFSGAIGFHFDFSMAGSFVFWKYVFMFLFVNSLESLLTVKATDNLDPWKRTSSYDGDLIGLGAGNFVSASLGGLPMISEVVRSTANIGFGARTKWSNFFHGLFLLLAMLFLIPFIELIPNSALAAMLIYAGYRLAAPRQFLQTYRIGKEQLAIFIATILVTLATDLLLGVATGILVKFIFHLFNGAPYKTLFKAVCVINKKSDRVEITVLDSAIFSNLIGFKNLFKRLDKTNRVKVDMSKTKIIDISFLSFIEQVKVEFNDAGGQLQITGMENHHALADHTLATRVLKP